MYVHQSLYIYHIWSYFRPPPPPPSPKLYGFLFIIFLNFICWFRPLLCPLQQSSFKSLKVWSLGDQKMAPAKNNHQKLIPAHGWPCGQLHLSNSYMLNTHTCQLNFDEIKRLVLSCFIFKCFLKYVYMYMYVGIRECITYMVVSCTRKGWTYLQRICSLDVRSHL